MSRLRHQCSEHRYPEFSKVWGKLFCPVLFSEVAHFRTMSENFVTKGCNKTRYLLKLLQKLQQNSIPSKLLQKLLGWCYKTRDVTLLQNSSMLLQNSWAITKLWQNSWPVVTKLGECVTKLGGCDKSRTLWQNSLLQAGTDGQTGGVYHS